MKILIIDDEKEFATTLCQRLQLRSYSVMEAHNGKEGLEAVENSTPDVVLLDLKMPDMDGLEVLSVLREKKPQVQVIMLTGHGSGKAGEDALVQGAYAYLMKPVDFKELLLTIEQAGRRIEAKSE